MRLVSDSRERLADRQERLSTAVMDREIMAEETTTVIAKSVRANESIGNNRRVEISLAKQLTSVARLVKEGNDVALTPDVGFVHGMRALDIARIFENKGCQVRVNGNFKLVERNENVEFHTFEGVILIFGNLDLEWNFREGRDYL
jgi:hypothetical protein